MPSLGLGVAVVNLKVIRDRANAAGGAAAARAMARQGKQTDREVLMLRQHPAHTRTPSPPGSPPAMISGRLVADIGSSEARPLSATTWEAHAGPTGRVARSQWGPYGRFLEFGGTHYAHTERGMRWQEPEGVWHGSNRYPIMEITKGSRDYLDYAMRVMLADGSLHDAAVEGFSRAMGF